MRSNHILLTACCTLLGWHLTAQTLLWSDEFNGSELDRNTWTFDVGNSGFGNGELQAYTDDPANVRVENGNLVITAIRDGNSFTSARLKSIGRLDFKYGRAEIRVKLPDVANGLWPAFWLMGNRYGADGWPYCGEIDIMEVGFKSAIDAGTVNHTSLSAAHWWHETGTWGPWLQADYAQETTVSSNFYNGYHTFGIDWTPTEIKMYVDDPTNPHFIMDITAAELSELKDNPAFFLLNLAVGGINFVEITDPAQITAPFPAEMLVDYVRIYDNGFATVNVGSNPPKTGNFGILTETTTVNDEVHYGSDAELYVWNNMVGVSNVTPQEGSEAWSFDVTANNWCGMGVACTGGDINMKNYSDGFLKFHMKTTSTDNFNIGVISSGADGGSVEMVAGTNDYGLVRDGNWHEVSIPLNLMGNVDFNTIIQAFTFVCHAPSQNFNVSFDNIYWQESATRPAPTQSFGIFTETTPVNYMYQLGVNGEFYIWENTLQPAAETPYEGSGCLSLTSTPGLNWFGLAFTPFIKYDLSAFHNDSAKLHVSVKTSSSATFQIGMKSGNVDGIGQQWITFESGNDPYGLLRDGNWHHLEIPMSHFYNRVDLSQVSQLFEILGTTGPITDLQLDDIYITGGSGSNVSMHDNSVNHSIHVYPNPVGDYLNLSVPAEMGNGEVEIVNLTGQVVQRMDWSTKTNKLEVSGLESGIYLLNFISDNQNYTVKFIKK
ncbi:MAG: hypothetical protein CMI36_02730 [Owenweeksia sp.]|nr:hypothetical protein [Owenweeksia sp.]MBF97882.1 hypothetical protein [Owenweeksia sp.]